MAVIVDSNLTKVRVLPNTEFSQKLVTTKQPYTFSAPFNTPTLNENVPRIDPFNPDGSDPVWASGGTVTNGFSKSRAWIWGSQFHWDSVRERVCAIYSPANFLGFGDPSALHNSYITMLGVYDLASNAFRVYESPLNVGNVGWPRSVGHMFDNQCIRGDVLYKYTTPMWLDSTQGYVQPQLCKINVGAVDVSSHNNTSAREGNAFLGTISPPPRDNGSPENNTTAPGITYMPNIDRIVLFHKDSLWFLNPVTEVWDNRIQLPVVDPSLHCMAIYQYNAGCAVVGGGAYNPDGPSNDQQNYQFFKIVDDPVAYANGTAWTQLDVAPALMSMSEVDMPGPLEAKACATADPNSTDVLFFHDNYNIYALDPTRPSGQQWRTVAQNTSGEEIDWVCSIPKYKIIMTGHHSEQVGRIRLFKGA